jgi:hypothetical protein
MVLGIIDLIFIACVSTGEIKASATKINCFKKVKSFQFLRRFFPIGAKKILPSFCILVTLISLDLFWFF